MKNQDTQKILQANFANIVRKVKAGKPLTTAEIGLIEAKEDTQTTSTTSTVGVGEFGEMVSLTNQRLNQLTKLGYMPRPKHGRMSMAEAVAGICRYYREQLAKRSSFESARARKEDALASLAELELAKRRGRVVDLADAVAGWEDRIMKCRSRIQGWPVRIAPLLQFQRSQSESQGLLTNAVNDLLRELAAPIDYRQARPEPVEIDQDQPT